MAHHLLFVTISLCNFLSFGVYSVQTALTTGTKSKLAISQEQEEIKIVSKLATFITDQTKCVKYWYVVASEASLLNDLYSKINDQYTEGVFQLVSDSFPDSNSSFPFLRRKQAQSKNHYDHIKYNSNCRLHIFLDFKKKVQRYLKFKESVTHYKKIGDNRGPDDFFVFYASFSLRIEMVLKKLKPLRISKSAIIRHITQRRHQQPAGGNTSMWILESFCPECEPQRGEQLFSYSPLAERFTQNNCRLFETCLSKYGKINHRGRTDVLLRRDVFHFLGSSITEYTTCVQILPGQTTDHLKLLISIVAKKLQFDCVIHSGNKENREAFEQSMENQNSILILADTEMVQINKWKTSGLIRTEKRITFPLVNDHLAFAAYVVDSEIDWRYYIFEVLSQPFDKKMFLTTLGFILGVGGFAKLLTLFRTSVLNQHQRVDLSEGLLMAYSLLWQHQWLPSHKKRPFNRLTQAAFLFPGWIISASYMGNMMAILTTSNEPFNNLKSFNDLLQDQSYKLVIPYENIGPPSFQRTFRKRFQVVPDLHECLMLGFWTKTVCVNTRINLETAILNLTHSSSFRNEFRKIYISSDQTYKLQETWKMPPFVGHFDTFQAAILDLQASGIVQHMYASRTSSLYRDLNQRNKRKRKTNIISIDLFFPILDKAYLLGILIGITVFLVEMCTFANHQRKKNRNLKQVM